MSGPTPAEHARTALALARVGTLVTYPRLAPPAAAPVVVGDDDGAPVLQLDVRAPAVADLAARPLGTVRVAPAGCETVTVQGCLQRLPDANRGTLARFRLEVGAVRLGARRDVVVDPRAFRTAEPDPLRDEAPGVLAHLAHGHGEQLAACLRRHGLPGAQWAQARRLDRYGLELAVLDDDGVRTARLDFPAPVRRLADLAPGLGVLLQARGRCADCADCPAG